MIVHREPELNHAHEDVYVALRDAFAAAQRQLEDRVRLLRGEIKRHEVPAHGRVARMFPSKGYGFIDASDGREIYFHRKSVVNGAFRRLRTGMQVRFVAHDFESDKGPQASTVAPLGKRSLLDEKTV